MSALLLTVAYDGTEFSGWLAQEGQRCVQTTLTDAIRKMDPDASAIRAASKTDAGVHAWGQAVAFDSEKDIPAENWLRGLNGYLPLDVVVRSAEVRPTGYNPRFDASSKLYRYVCHVGFVRDPLVRRMSWHLGPNLVVPPSSASRDEVANAHEWLDISSMEQVCKEWTGTHDFRAFQASNDYRTHTVRTMISIDVICNFNLRSDLIAIEVRGTAFLKNMVRILSGTLIEVGRRRMAAQHAIGLVCDGACRELAGPTAPAAGLTLIEVKLGRAESA